MLSLFVPSLSLSAPTPVPVLSFSAPAPAHSLSAHYMRRLLSPPPIAFTAPVRRVPESCNGPLHGLRPACIRPAFGPAFLASIRAPAMPCALCALRSARTLPAVSAVPHIHDASASPRAHPSLTPRSCSIQRAPDAHTRRASCCTFAKSPAQPELPKPRFAHASLTASAVNHSRHATPHGADACGGSTPQARCIALAPRVWHAHHLSPPPPCTPFIPPQRSVPFRCPPAPATHLTRAQRAHSRGVLHSCRVASCTCRLIRSSRPSCGACSRDRFLGIIHRLFIVIVQRIRRANNIAENSRQMPLHTVCDERVLAQTNSRANAYLGRGRHKSRSGGGKGERCACNIVGSPVCTCTTR
jgi:hypothetical protein